MTLIKDSKKSTVAQYIRKTLAKKRLSVEKAAASAGGGESAKSGGDAADQKKEESEKFVSLLSKVSLNLYTHILDIIACVISQEFLIIGYPRCVPLSLSFCLSHSLLIHTNTHTCAHNIQTSTTFPPGSNTILAEIFKKIGQPAESKQVQFPLSLYSLWALCLSPSSCNIYYIYNSTCST